MSDDLRAVQHMHCRVPASSSRRKHKLIFLNGVAFASHCPLSVKRSGEQNAQSGASTLKACICKCSGIQLDAMPLVPLIEEEADEERHEAWGRRSEGNMPLSLHLTMRWRVNNCWVLILQDE